MELIELEGLLREFFTKNKDGKGAGYAARIIKQFAKKENRNIRQAFADYTKAEGCSCCRDNEGHELANKRLAELLNCEKYEDGSGFNWNKYRTKPV